MSRRIDLFFDRTPVEEGDRRKAYNDATGKTVTCQPEGNLTIGRGINLEVGLDSDEDHWLFYHRAGLVDIALSKFSWYLQLDDVRGSVILDIAYNLGFEKFTTGFPRMIKALERGDLPSAVTECHVKDDKLDQQRYAPLRQLLLTGVLP